MSDLPIYQGQLENGYAPIAGYSNSNPNLPRVTPSTPIAPTPASEGNTEKTAQYDTNGNLTGYKNNLTGIITPASSPSNFTPAPANPAADYLSGKNFTPPPTEDENYKKLLDRSADLITATNKGYEDEMKVKNAASAARINAGGLAGSSAGGTITEEAIEPIVNARNTALAKIYSDIETNAENLTLAEKAQASSDAKDIIAYQDKIKSDAQNTLGDIAKSNLISLDDLKNNQPQLYNHYVQAFGSDPNSVDAYFTLHKSQDTILDSKIVGSTYYQITKDPVTGATHTQHFDLGFTPPVDSTSIKVGSDVLIYPKQGLGGKTMEEALRDGTVQVYHGTNDPMTQAIKNLTIANKSQDLTTKQVRMEATKALFATRLVGSQVKSDKRIQNFLSISPAMGRIQASKEDIAQNGVNPANLGDLIEAVTQVNSGGGQITEGKLDLIRQTQSYQSLFDTLAQKVKGEGGVVSANTAKQMIELSTKIFNIYESEYKKATSQYEDRLKKTPLGDLTGYSPLTNITALNSVISGANEKNLNDTINNTTVSDMQPDIYSEITDSGATDNGDGTFTMPDGTIVDPTQ